MAASKNRRFRFRLGRPESEPTELPTFQPLTVHTSLLVENLIEKTKYGEQFCSIGVFIKSTSGFEGEYLTPMVIRRVVHQLEMKNIDPFQCERNDFLTPRMSYRDEQKDAFFVAYDRRDGSGSNFEMTFDWYMKKHHKMNNSKDGLLCEASIQPVLIFGPNNLWSFSGIFKKFLGDIVKRVDLMHSMACTHGDLSANNIVIFFRWEMREPKYKANLVNCFQQHNLEKEEEKKLFEARKKKDWEAVLKLILDTTTDLKDCFDYELTHFLNKLKISKEKGLVTKASFKHPAIWLRYEKENVVRKLKIKIVAKKLSELGFLDGVDWRKLVHENVLRESQEDAWDRVSDYRRYFDGEFNDSIMDFLCFMKYSYSSYEPWIPAQIKSMGYSAMDLYLQSLFPDFFVKLHQLEGIDKLRYRETYSLD